ncbi:Cytochrome c oxidase assembly protein cox15 [Ascosphaera pollenicola]|nr:Cytochrome c oxidase assembly protein cox15 [Ascosphaera pollenicola]
MAEEISNIRVQKTLQFRTSTSKMKFFAVASVLAFAGAAVAAPSVASAEASVPAVADVSVNARDAQISLDSVLKCVDPVLDVLVTELKGLSHGQIVQIESGIQQGKPPQEVIGISTGLVHVLTDVVSCLGTGLGDLDEELKDLLLKILRALQL